MSEGTNGMMAGSYRVVVGASPVPFESAEIDVSVLLPEGEDAVVMGAHEDFGTVSVWPISSISHRTSRLARSLVGGTGDDDGRNRILWDWFQSFETAGKVRDGKATLSSKELRALEVEVGDELLLIGCNDYIEVWNPERWEEATVDFEEELEALFAEYLSD